MCKNTEFAKYDKLYIFEKPLPRRNQTYKKLCKNLFAKIVRSASFLFKAFQRAIKSQNPMTESRSKYRFSRVKVKIRHLGGVLSNPAQLFIKFGLEKIYFTCIIFPVPFSC